MNQREEDAQFAVREALVRTYRRSKKEPLGDAETLKVALFAATAEVTQAQPRAGLELSFAELDSLIRSDPTQSGVLDRLAEAERERLLWELKQGCLTAVLNCLPPGERVAFILAEVQEEDAEHAAQILGINPSAFRVRVSRARKKVVAYLAPRCAHVNPRNPCRCPGRLGVALDRGFIGEVRGRQISLRARPFEKEPPQHDPVALFRTLPLPDPPVGWAEELLDELAAGEWEEGG